MMMGVTGGPTREQDRMKYSHINYYRHTQPKIKSSSTGSAYAYKSVNTIYLQIINSYH